ncbi:calcium-binding protein [Paroceanicella profunda]|uniref:Calcium-binding protein n=1 Tax=Paroceanicella profunda TaxID=2579971 RepID=A0A5B8FS60_9RHOB|nr:calcium-binding protein [Paroceanicella profunda]QDL91195.1 calcium-binding protein [Paroceanicella profunda]
MQTTVTLLAATGIDLDAYFANFDANFSLSGFGAFSNMSTFSGDYMGTSGDAEALAFLVDGDLGYQFSNHHVDGTIDTISFGTDGDAVLNTETGLFDLSLGSTDFTIDFTPDLATADGDDVHGLVYDLMSDGTAPEGNTSTLVSLLDLTGVDLVGSAGNDRFNGTSADDHMTGGWGRDVFYGGQGADVLVGNIGNDRLFGGAGDDKLYGGRGNDLLRGGAGDDILAGGKGADTFVFRGSDLGVDRINDFTVGLDFIRLSASDFSGFEDLSISEQGGNAYIDLGDGDGILLAGVDADSLSAGDFQFV